MELADAMRLGDGLLMKHGLYQSWKIAFHKRRVVCGTCSPDQFTIFLSAPYVKLNPEEEVRDTILHEIAHALNRNKPEGEGAHGPTWRRICASIGCSGRRLASPTVKWPPAPYEGKCGCEYVRKRYNKPRRRLWCRGCGKMVMYYRVRKEGD